MIRREFQMGVQLVARVQRSLLSIVAVLVLAVETPAEFVQIEPVAARIAEEAAPLVKGATVVVASRAAGPATTSWPMHEAVAVEVTAALCARGIDAVRAESHPTTASLGKAATAFKASDARSVKAAGRDLLIAVTVASKPPSIEIGLFPADGGEAMRKLEFKLPPECFDLDSNVPELNRKVVAFCRQSLGSPVGDGICATLPGEALKAAGAERSGIYTWGRELDAGEPVLPGDILQLERVKLRGRQFSRSFEHHTAVVEEVRGDAIIVLHQNAFPKGKVVQRETWPTSVASSGIIQAYRPWTGESPLPVVLPRRRQPPRVVRQGSTIDLLQTLDPRLDSIRGLWFRDGGLKWNRDTYARLQVPVEPPERYTLRLKVRRLFGNDQFGIGLIVGGHQALLSIDGYGGTKTGLHLLDGKKSKDSEGAYAGRVLPENTLVVLTVGVRPNAVRLQANGKTILDWTGDAARLSMDKNYAVPRSDWLFLASWNTQCEVTEYSLVEE